MRDLISGRSPVGIIQTSYLFLMVLGTVFAGFLFFFGRDLWGKTGRPPKSSSGDGSFRWASAQGVLEISDAIGLSTFTVIGVMVAVEQHCEPLWLWGPVFAALTGAGGGILRDVLRAQADIPTLKGSLYPEIAILWGFVYSAAIISLGSSLELSGNFLADPRSACRHRYLQGGSPASGPSLPFSRCNAVLKPIRVAGHRERTCGYRSYDLRGVF